MVVEKSCINSPKQLNSAKSLSSSIKQSSKRLVLANHISCFLEMLLQSSAQEQWPCNLGALPRNRHFCTSGSMHRLGRLSGHSTLVVNVLVVVASHSLFVVVFMSCINAKPERSKSLRPLPCSMHCIRSGVAKRTSVISNGGNKLARNQLTNLFSLEGTVALVQRRGLAKSTWQIAFA